MRTKTYRDQLCECLMTLSSGEEQLNYEKTVTIAYIPEEITCQFFDDFYHPKAEGFLKTFSEEEIIEIGIFSGYLDIAFEEVKKNGRQKVAEVLKYPRWREMMDKAKRLLELLKKMG